MAERFRQGMLIRTMLSLLVQNVMAECTVMISRALKSQDQIVGKTKC